MDSKSSSIKNKSYITIWVLFFIIITSLCAILSLLINPFWWILLPISLFFIIIIQLISRYFWLEKNICPRCNASTSKYSEFCKNCGLKLWFRCLSCGKYLRVDIKFCDNCNIQLEHTVEEKETFEFEGLKKSSLSFEKPNFCFNCGKEVKSSESIEFCEECGEKLK